MIAAPNQIIPFSISMVWIGTKGITSGFGSNKPRTRITLRFKPELIERALIMMMLRAVSIEIQVVVRSGIGQNPRMLVEEFGSGVVGFGQSVASAIVDLVVGEKGRSCG